jgi:hypothetical protein
LQAAYIGDPVLSARVAARVNLILTTVASFAALMPQTSVLPTAQKMAHPQVAIPKASDLKKQWNQQVCWPTRNPSLDFSTTLRLHGQIARLSSVGPQQPMPPPALVAQVETLFLPGETLT